MSRLTLPASAAPGEWRHLRYRCSDRRRTHSREMWALHRRTLERGIRPTVPTVGLGQAWRGGHQAQMSRLLRGCHIEPLTEAQARSAGTALAAIGDTDLVDAALVVFALARGDLVVTSSDPEDVSRFAAGLGCSVAVHVV